LFDAVEAWAAAGMATITGRRVQPVCEVGMLVEGYEHLPTMSTYYNFPYYNDLLAQYGFDKDVDYVEYIVRGITMRIFPSRWSSRGTRRAARKVPGAEFSAKKGSVKAFGRDLRSLAGDLFELYG